MAKVMAIVKVTWWLSLRCAERGPADGPRGQGDGQSIGSLLGVLSVDQQVNHMANVMAKVMVIYWFSLRCVECGPVRGPCGQGDGQSNGDLMVPSWVCRVWTSRWTTWPR